MVFKESNLNVWVPEFAYDISEPISSLDELKQPRWLQQVFSRASNNSQNFEENVTLGVNRFNRRVFGYFGRDTYIPNDKLGEIFTELGITEDKSDALLLSKYLHNNALHIDSYFLFYLIRLLFVDKPLIA